ncbi:hypothetical protein DTO021C3_6832 [Paecilomyces variotii]|nr:hypothetical protein DTO021C3_6832 [Paecilomyces variotii]
MTAVTSNRASLKQIPIDEDGIPITVSCADLQMIQDKETGFCLIQKPSFPTADLGLAHGTGHYCIGHILHLLAGFRPLFCSSLQAEIVHLPLARVAARLKIITPSRRESQI